MFAVSNAKLFRSEIITNSRHFAYRHFLPGPSDNVTNRYIQPCCVAFQEILIQ